MGTGGGVCFAAQEAPGSLDAKAGDSPEDLHETAVDVLTWPGCSDRRDIC